MNKKEKYTKFMLRIILPLILIIISSIWLSSITEYNSFNNYEWDFSKDSLKNATFRDVEIYHDFSRDRGEIKFEIRAFDIDGDSAQKTFDIFLPGKLKDYEISKSSDKSKTYEKLEAHKIHNYPTETQLIITDPNLEVGDKYLITYKTSNVFPNGKFNIGHQDIRFEGYTPKITLNLGEKYNCEGQCIGSLHFVKEDYNSDYKIIILEMDAAMMDPAFHSFKIYSKKDNETLIAILVGIILSSIFIVFQWGEKYLEEILIGKKLKTRRKRYG